MPVRVYITLQQGKNENSGEFLKINGKQLLEKGIKRIDGFNKCVFSLMSDPHV